MSRRDRLQLFYFSVGCFAVASLISVIASPDSRVGWLISIWVVLGLLAGIRSILKFTSDFD
jgi:hypothetical protein